MGIMKRYTFKQIRIFKIWIWFKCLCTITYNLWVHNTIKFQWRYEFYFLKYIYVYIIFFVSNCQQPCGFLEELMVTQPGCLSAPNHCLQVSVTHTSLWLFFHILCFIMRSYMNTADPESCGAQGPCFFASCLVLWMFSFAKAARQI